METPILNELKKKMEDKTISFHTPGHKGKNTLINWGDYIPYIDTTEIEGTDNLLDPKGIIKKSQELAAKVFGAKHTYYSVNGSTGSIYISLATIIEPGDKILVQRNSHKAIYNAMILNRLNPIYIYPNYNEKYNIYTGIDPKEIEEILSKDKDIKAVVLTYPDYYGICSDMETIGKIVHKYNRILMVDEAHGSHMGFSGKLPKSALEAGADIVVQSTHKTLPSFTQTSMIHIGTDRIDLNKLKDSYQLYTTTSPSYLFTTSCEIAAAYMDTVEARERLDINIRKSNELIDRLKNIDRITIFENDINDKTIFHKDNTKILFKIEGMTGSQIEKTLYAKYNIQLEMSDLYYGLILTSLMNEEEDYDEIIKAIEDLVRTEKYEYMDFINVETLKPKIVELIYKAYHGNKETIEFKNSIGRVSGTTVIPYPPGIPLLVPGEEVTEELYKHIGSLMENGIEIIGLIGYNKDKIAVVK